MCRLFSITILFLISTTKYTIGLASTKSKSKKGSGGGVGFGATKKSNIFAPDTSATSQNLWKFLKSANSKGLDNVEMGFDVSTGIRGLYATKNIKKNQMVCQIPSDCALALADPTAVQQTKDDDDTSLAQNGLFFLQKYMQTEDARKLWSPYLDTLPTKESKQFTPTPDFYSSDQIELFEFPKMIAKINQRQKDIQELIEQNNNIQKDELEWATWLVSSRSLPIQISSNDGDGDNSDDDSNDNIIYDEKGQVITKAKELKSIRVLVPLLDMVNHHEKANVQYTIIDPEKDDAWFTLQANCNIKAGQEILLTYGSGIYSSMDFLLNYGFLKDKNFIDKYMLQKCEEEYKFNIDDWTTTYKEDQIMMEMVKNENDVESQVLKKILQFRMNVKKSYKED